MFKRIVIGIAVLALIFSTMGTVFAQELAPQVKEMVGAAKAAVKMVSADDVKAAIDAKEKAIILDIRDGGEYAAGHLPGAMNISRGTLEFKVFGAIPDLNAKIYVYCKTSGRAALATKTLNDLGYKNAVLANFQYADWVKAGYPVER